MSSSSTPPTETPKSNTPHTTYNDTTHKAPKQDSPYSGEGSSGTGNKSRRGWTRFLPWMAGLIAIPSAYTAYSVLYGVDEEDRLIQNDDTQALYRTKSTPDLLFSLAILKLCSIQTLVHYGPKALGFLESIHLSAPAYWVVKKTFFKNFCAGTTMAETTALVESLNKESIGVILDYAVEAANGGKEQWDSVAENIVRTIELSSKNNDLAFSCLKVSGLTSYSLLERLSANIEIVTVLEKGGHASQVGGLQPLTPEEQEELQQLEHRLHKICQAASHHGVPLLIDAEQTWYQPAIDNLVISLSRRYNTSRPLVYNTYQMYRKDTLRRLHHDIDEARARGYLLGVKLVRGAYMTSERERAASMGRPDPIQDTLADTHNAYYQGLELTLDNLFLSGPGGQEVKDKDTKLAAAKGAKALSPAKRGVTGLMVGSHNENSILRAVDQVRSRNIDPRDRSVQFAQLYGMGDHLTLHLAHEGQRVFKYVPYGPIEYVMPYLFRRMQENTGFLGSTSAKERALLRAELRRRAGVAPSSLPSPSPSPASPSSPSSVSEKK
eukprot:TRINITY_DN5104_c0_g1_i4.p1 TRINITY_DN5104_c0_g1~~TRINITY_DN5104_c0_g1_i4.p1  ORF type:complete len:612 (-),score=124.82 TRINITY_DN5104_c0_g1_i4:23-1672(-)